MTRLSWITVVVAGAVAGCANGGADPAKAKKHDPGNLASANVLAALTRTASCDDLLQRIQDDVIAKIDVQAELLKEGGADYYNDGYQGGGVSGPTRGEDDGLSGAAGNGAPPPQASPGNAGVGGDSGGENSGGGKGDPEPTDHSMTNVQVEGVDEADIVKTDGTHIYLLHGNELFVLKSWPADETAIETSIAIEGYATEMFVAEGKAAVFSSTYDQGDLIEPTTVNAMGSQVRSYYGSSFTKITLIDVTGGTPSVERELFIEGNYLSSRLHGDTVRAVIQGGFRTPQLYAAGIQFFDPWGREYEQEEIDAQVDAWRDRMIAAVENTGLADWLPVEREVIDGELSKPQRRCTDFYAPSPGLTDYGLTNVVSLSISDPDSTLGGAILLGNVDEVYSNESALVLAQRDWRWDQRLIEKERTILHRFGLDGTDTAYEASGWVTGHIIDQFSLDERDGVIRVATTSRLWSNFDAPVPAVANAAAAEADEDVLTTRTQTDNRVITLRAEGQGLSRVGISVPLGLDGESLVSSRFVGDRGYIVTFEQKDPLVVVDLSDPEKLDVLGELTIPGFSDYMHPLDAGHLLTIGRDTDASGFDTGLMLQIFDVSDPTQPRRTHTYKFGENGYSEANVNHKAFTFHRPKGAPEGTGLLAFPYVGYDAGFSSSLEVFDVGASDGFTKLGSIAHTTLLQDLCGYDASQGYYQCVTPEVRRGLFIFGDEGDFVYSISYGGLLVHRVQDTTAPVASVPFSLPSFTDDRMLYDEGVTAPGGTPGSPGTDSGGSDTGGAEQDAGVGVGTGGSDSEPMPAAGAGG